MPLTFAVRNCYGNYRSGSKVKVCFPKQNTLRSKWITSKKFKSFEPTKNSKGCLNQGFRIHRHSGEFEHKVSKMVEPEGQFEDDIGDDIQDDIQTLLKVMNSLNLEPLRESEHLRNPSENEAVDVQVFLFYDLKQLEEYVKEQQKVYCSYGLDNVLFSEKIFQHLKVIASYFTEKKYSMSEYCKLKADLFVYHHRFYDHIFNYVAQKVQSNDPAADRLMYWSIKIKQLYSKVLG